MKNNEKLTGYLMYKLLIDIQNIKKEIVSGLEHQTNLNYTTLSTVVEHYVDLKFVEMHRDLEDKILKIETELELRSPAISLQKPRCGYCGKNRD